jgi:hypothetical protein
MIEDISCNLSTNRSMSSVIDAHSRKGWFEGQKFDTQTWTLEKADFVDDCNDDNPSFSADDDDYYNRDAGHASSVDDDHRDRGFEDTASMAPQSSTRSPRRGSRSESAPKRCRPSPGI